MIYDLIIDKLPGHDTTAKVGKINKKARNSIKLEDVILSVESGKGTIEFTSKYNEII